MDYVRLGQSGLRVSRLCLGTMNFGPLTSESDSFAIMDRALELGIVFFDTADVYGWRTGEGVTEQIIGRWLAQGGGRRERIVLATKVYGRMGPGPNDGRLSAYHIRQACERQQRLLERHRDRVAAYEALCRELGHPPAQVALAWVLHTPAVTAPIVGPRTLEQLDASLRALELRLPEDALAKLDRIFPGPGGEAPEAYAW